MNGQLKMEKEFKPFPHFATNAIHVGKNPDYWTSMDVVPPITLSTTFKQKEPGKNSGFVYSRDGNPIRNATEECLASLEGGKHCVLLCSGSAAFSTITHLLQAGDHIIAMDDLYSGSNRYFRAIVPTKGIETSFVDATNVSNVRNAIQSNTKMIWIESPTNPLMKIGDIKAICEIVHAYSDAFVVIDNTFATPYFQRPLELGADIVMHSITKYLNGHDDVVMGCAITNDETLHKELRDLQIDMGPVPSPFDCYMVNRGLKTLAVRMKEHQSNALKIANFLESNSRIEKVLYPGLQSHPQYEIAKRQMKGYSGMISFCIKGGTEEARIFLSSLKLLENAVSLGGCKSMISNPVLMTHASMPSELRKSLGIHDGLMRLSVGIEDVEEIIADIDQALVKAMNL